MSERTLGHAPQRLVVAHRGASAIEAENTLPAFEAAILAGADVIEFDVRVTADGAAVVMHDADVARTTDGEGLVRDLSLSAVKGLRIRTREGAFTEVPTLEEALRSCSGRVGVDIEIKNIPGEPDFDADREPVVDQTVRDLEGSSFDGVVLVSSFNPFSIARARAMVPDLPTGLLTDPSVDAPTAVAYAHAQGHPWVLPYVERVLGSLPQVATQAHEVDMRLGAWITDDPEVALTLWEDGVDAVATNDPAALVAARGEARSA